jgi:hypothetical protein
MAPATGSAREIRTGVSTVPCAVSHENPVSTILRHRAPEVKKANVAYEFKSLGHGLDCKVI